MTVRDIKPTPQKPPKKYLMLDPSAKFFGQRLRYLMDYYGISAKQLSGATFIKVHTIRAYTGNRRRQGNPLIQCAVDIADFFEVSLDWLFGRTDDMRIHKEGEHEQR